jgi:hypothetical protein
LPRADRLTLFTPMIGITRFALLERVELRHVAELGGTGERR